jgi:excisionase family DNA binding protein
MTDRIALRIEEAAEVAGVSLATMFRRVKAGQVRSIKVGRRRIIARADLPLDPRKEEERAMQAFIKGEA